MTGALAAFGVLGWAHAMGVFTASKASLGAFLTGLDGLWPLYATAALACIAAQVIAACAVVNFARLAKAALVWRALAFAFYSVSVVFAAYSADRGAQVIMGSAQRAAYEAQEMERSALVTEIAALGAQIERERARMPDAATTFTSRMVEARQIFEAATAAARSRLPEAQRQLAERPPIPAERAPTPLDGLVFLLFLAWATLEPWGYALAERGQVAKAPTLRPRSARLAPKPAPNVVSLPRKPAQGVGRVVKGAAASFLPLFAFGAASAPDAVAEPAPRISTASETADAARVATQEDVVAAAEALGVKASTRKIARTLQAYGINCSQATAFRRLRDAQRAGRWSPPLTGASLRRSA